MNTLLTYIFICLSITYQSFGINKVSLDSSSVQTDSTMSFMILTKDCKHCQDAFKITILVNDTIYMKTLAKDSVYIDLPYTQPDDIITIQKHKDYKHTWNCQSWTHNREYTFKIKNKHIVRLKSIHKVKSNFSHKKGYSNLDM